MIESPDPPPPKKLLSWLGLILCIIVIYLTVPVARKIQKFVYDNWGRTIFLYFVLVVLGLFLLALLHYLIFRLKVRSLPKYAWLALIAVLYLHFALQLRSSPEETVHFLEYGLLSFFLFRVLRFYVQDKSIYMTATLCAMFIGTIDEVLQWIMPERIWDFRDAGLNGLSGGLFQLALLTVVRPSVISKRFQARSFRILGGVSSACLVLLGLCVSNTPNRVNAYTEKFAWLSPLRQQEPMSEFGFKYKDPEIGVFYSRLDPQNLTRIDLEKAEEHSRKLNGTRKMNYNAFLGLYTPGQYPFMHEIRVHLFRRDKYFLEASSATDPVKKRDSYFVAYKENLILKKYFTNTLQKTAYMWDEKKEFLARRRIEPEAFYKSPVSANLFTLFTEKQMWSLILTVVTLLVLTSVLLGRNRKYGKIETSDKPGG